ncbi:hypothetical protein, partial [Desulfocastanea catecholica]
LLLAPKWTLNFNREKKNDQREIIRELESLGVGTAGSLQAWSVRYDMDSKTKEGGNNGRRISPEARAAERSAGAFGKRIIWNYQGQARLNQNSPSSLRKPKAENSRIICQVSKHSIVNQGSYGGRLLPVLPFSGKRQHKNSPINLIDSLMPEGVIFNKNQLTASGKEFLSILCIRNNGDPVMKKVVLLGLTMVILGGALFMIPVQSHANQNVGQCMGDCASEQGLCISECQGDGQCIGRCGATHGRCVARCH